MAATTVERKIITTAADDGSASVICIYVNGEQVAGARCLDNDGTADLFGRYHWHLVSLIDGMNSGRAPLMVESEEQVRLWLNFLADLYEGRFTK